MTILHNSAKASQRSTKNLYVFLLTYALLGLLALTGLIYRAGAAPVRAEVTAADAPAQASGLPLPALQPSAQITASSTLTPLDVMVAFDISGSMEDQTICHDCWVRTSYNPNWPNNGYFNPIPYNKVWKDTVPGGPGATGNQSIPASALCTTYPPQPYLDSGFQYLTVEAELYSRNGGDWHLDARVPGQGFWVIQRGSKRSGNNTSVAGNNLQNGTPTPGEDNDQRNATGDPTQQSSNVCRPNAGGIDCTVGGSNDDICSSADGGIAADCSAYLAARPFHTYTQSPGQYPHLVGAAYNADCFSGSALSGACWSQSPFVSRGILTNPPSNVPYVEYDFTPSWNGDTSIWIRAIGGGSESFTWAGPSPDERIPDVDGGGVSNNITPWRKVIHWQVDNGNINQRKDNMNSDYSNSPTDNGSRYFQPALAQPGSTLLTWRDNRAINDSWRWIKLGSTATISGTQSILKLFQGSAGYKVDKIVFTNDSSGSTPATGTTISSTVPAVLLQRSDGSITSTTSGEAIGPPASPGSATREACNVCNPIYGYTVNPSQCSCKRTANDTANGGYGSGVGCTLLSTTTNLLQAELQTGLYSGLQPIRSAQEAVKNFARQLDPQFDQLGFVPFVASQDNTDAQSDPNRRAKLQCLAWAAQNQGNPASCYDPNLETPISFTQVISVVERQWPESGTNIAIGLREGLEELGVSTPGNLVTNHCTPTVNDAYACDRGGAARKVLILMTDGIPNANPGNCADDDGLGAGQTCGMDSSAPKTRILNALCITLTWPHKTAFRFILLGSAQDPILTC
ncbi:MAG: hypothetical protein HC875_11740 [Anaerolineales bacterium]|nr:hypothetical protein [Anaerolineales bacterium]